MIVRIASRCSYARAAPDAFAILSRYGRFYEESERERERPGSLRNRGFMGRMEREDESHEGGTRAVGQHRFANARLRIVYTVTTDREPLPSLCLGKFSSPFWPFSAKS